MIIIYVVTLLQWSSILKSYEEMNKMCLKWDWTMCLKYKHRSRFIFNAIGKTYVICQRVGKTSIQSPISFTYSLSL